MIERFHFRGFIPAVGEKSSSLIHSGQVSIQTKRLHKKIIAKLQRSKAWRGRCQFKITHRKLSTLH